MVENCSLEGWSIEGDSFFVYDDNPEEVLQPYWNAETKPQDVIVEAYNEDYESTSRVFADAFTVKRRTTFDRFNASPEPVSKGSKITVKGRLRIADWTDERYEGFTKRPIKVQYRTRTGSYSTIKTVYSGSGGYVSTTVTARADGYWRITYGGNSYAGSAKTAGDFVDVR